MQPEAAQVIGLHPFGRHMVGDVLADQRQHLFEDLPPVLHELHVAAVFHLVMGAAEVAVVVADIVAELRRAAGGEDLELGLFQSLIPFKQGRRRHVAEDEVTIPVPPFQMGRADFRVHHQRPADGTRTDHVCRRLDAEGSAGTGDVHVEGKAARAQKLLDFHGNRRIGALHV